MKASIVVCSYNQGQYLGDALESLIRQSNLLPGELEIIVVDGMSTDNSMEVISRYRDRLDVVVREPDRGQADALRKGFRMATGEIFGWLCSDDLLEPTTIRAVLDQFRESPEARFIYGDALFIGASGRVIEVKREIQWHRFIWLHDHNYILQPSAFWRRELYEEAGEIDIDLQVCLDEELFARFASLTQPHHVRRVWSSLRMYPGIKTYRLRGIYRAEHGLILQKWGAGYSSSFDRLACFVAAKCWRTFLKISTNCYGDSFLSQVWSLLSKDRWLEVLGVPRAGLGGD